MRRSFSIGLLMGIIGINAAYADSKDDFCKKVFMCDGTYFGTVTDRDANGAELGHYDDEISVEWIADKTVQVIETQFNRPGRPDRESWTVKFVFSGDGGLFVGNMNINGQEESVMEGFCKNLRCGYIYNWDADSGSASTGVLAFVGNQLLRSESTLSGSQAKSRSGSLSLTQKK